MAIHSELTGIGAVHPAAFVSAYDPKAVGADKFWVDTSHDPPWLWLRNAADTDWILIVDVHQSDVGALSDALDAHAGDETAHGQLSLAQRLIAWCEGEAFEMLAATYDAIETMVIASATVQWPDGSAGTFTTTAINSTWKAIDAYTVTHNDSSLTVTQAAVTRNADGLIAVKPALTVA